MTLVHQEPASGEKIEALHGIQLATLNILEDFNAEKLRLEVTQRAVLNVLEDFGFEKSRLENMQRATFNILEDFGAEKLRLEGTQRAVLNILDDFNAEKLRLEGSQRAVLNILDDFNAERLRLEGSQRAVLNILDDFNAERLRLEETQRAVMNVLEDFGLEKGHLERTQKAAFNLLQDFNDEKLRLETTQGALLNILDDFDDEKTKVEKANLMLQLKSEELDHSNKELQEARAILEFRVAARTAELRESNAQLRAQMEERQEAEKEIRLLNENLKRRAAELEASNKELEAFSYSVSHDLRAPLRILDGFSQAVLEDYSDKLDATGKEFLKQIRNSSQLMARLIDDILNLARITRTEIRLQIVDLSNLAVEVTNELKLVYPGRKVDVVIQPDLKAYGDAHLLKIVLANLLGNAFKFTGRQPAARIEFGVTDRGGAAAYFVRDNGAGFDMAYVNKLFKPFQRLHHPDEFTGTGIGLASVQRIISRMGGKIWAEGEVGKGATFYFTLRESQ